MALLKFVLPSKGEVDALPEAVRGLYKEKDGKFFLDVDGAIAAEEALDLKTKLAEFRDNNRNMHSELETLRPLAKKFEGVDPDEYVSLKEEVGTLRKKGIKGVDDVQSAIDKAVQAAVKPINDALAMSKAAQEAATRLADAAKFRELVTAEATKAGVAATSVRHVLRDAEQVFELADGSLAPRKGVKHPTEPLKELTPGDWLAALSKTDANLFEGSIGGGAPGGTKGDKSGAKPGARRLINPTPEEMGANIDALAKGEVTVVRQ